ncbi:MAG: PKD domain-containing protein [Flavipsychrobacter sp.]|nr:PKD domain-containing protein [Flavipsychrobacter sp.]
MKLYPRFLYLLLCLCFSAQSFALTAGFTATPTSGCAPLVVNFTNTTSPSSGTTYVWSFGPSSSSTLTDPSTSFTTPGTHVVTLTATNGSAVSTYTLAVTVYPPPVVSFSADDTAVCPCTPITFTSTSTGSVPGPMTYSWNWGDGSPTGTGATATHSYCTPGYYTVTLFVTNATGCVASLVRSSYIHIYNPPTANFTWSPFAICNPPGSITFTSLSVGAAPLTCSWDFGDMTGAGAGSPVSHLYTAVGSYNPRLIVTDGNGCKDTTTLGPVIVDTIRAQFTYADTVCRYSYVTFPNTSSPHTSRTWDYGDGSPTTTLLNGSHAYSSTGVYTVTLTISNPPCTKTVTHVVHVVDGPTATITQTPAQPCPAPVAITYTASAPPGTSFAWDFGSGSGAGSPVSHTFTTNGVKTVRLITIDPSTGCKDTFTHTTTIYDLYFIADATPLEGCKPLTVNFHTDAMTSVPGPTYSPYPYSFASFTWNFADGSGPGSGPAPSHTFTAVGIYNVVVTGMTSNGCPVSDTVQIRVGEPPAATFTASPLHVCYGAHIPIIFTPVITDGPVDRWDWDFGDGGVTLWDTTAIAATHIYSIPGFFTVTLTPYFNGCPGVPFTRTNYITVDSPKSIIAYVPSCTPRTRVQFADSSMGDDSHVWMFGDGFTSTADHPLHDYPAATVYTVKLATYNANSGCRDTATMVIDLTPPVFSFVADDTTICKYDTVTLSPVITVGTATEYHWNLYNPYPTTSLLGGYEYPTGQFGYRFYTSTGQHTVRLIIKDGLGCFDTVMRTNYITVGKPVPNFTGAPLSGCVPLNVVFSDASSAAAGTTLSSYAWSFGDGGTSTVTTPMTFHTYTAAGTFDVREIVTDNIGCKDTVVRTGYITAYDPVATFTASNTHPCRYSPVTFTNTSTGGIVYSHWDFGDGDTSNITSPVHSYSASGTYTVKLTVYDSHGCTDVVTVTGLITVADPDAGFTMSDSVSVCPPLFVSFTNTTTGAVSYEWDFGDGGTSLVLSPSNMYIASGLYPVRLIATNGYGCKDTVIHPVNIFGYAGAFSYSPTQGCAPLSVHFSATLSNVPFITWDFSDGVTTSLTYTDTTVHIYTTPGAYVPKLILSDNTGCQTSSTGLDTIKVNAVYPKMSTNPSPVCIGIPFTMVDSSTSFWDTIRTWEWTYDGNTSTLSSPSHILNTPGTYPITLKVTDGWGCFGILSSNIVINPPPNVTASPDTVVCVTDPATLSGYGAATYTWSPPATLSCTTCNPTLATPDVPTTYTVTGTDANGCVDSATVTVGLRTHTISKAWGDTAVCEGVTVQLFDTGGTSYLWMPPTGLNSSTAYNPLASPPRTTTYTVIARLGSCIPDTNQVTVTIWPLPKVDAGPDQRLLAGSVAYLKASGTNMDTYKWWPGETLSCTECLTPVASMTMNTTYYIDAVSDKGCRASDSVRILLYCDNSMVFVPNVFTPNGDGQNDIFYPRGMGIKTIKAFRVYNRWGNLLFERESIDLNDAANGWDGSHKGEEPRPDVYVYLIEAVCYTGEDVHIKGDVTIVK